jgi:hypothetical protein
MLSSKNVSSREGGEEASSPNKKGGGRGIKRGFTSLAFRKGSMPPYNRTKVISLPRIYEGNVKPEETNPVTSAYKVNDYYNGFMRDHFLFENKGATSNFNLNKDENIEVSARLK